MFIRIAGILMVIALGLSVLIWNKVRVRPQNISGILEIDEIRLGSHVGGRIHEVLVVQGQEVEEGQVLVRLAPFNLMDLLHEAESQLEIAQATLDRLKSGFRSEEIAQARAKRDASQALYAEAKAGPRAEEIELAEQLYKEAQAELVAARVSYDRLVTLVDSNAVSKQDRDEARSRLDAAQARVNGRQSSLKMLRSGTRSEQIAQSKAKLEQSQAELTLIEAGARDEEIREATARVNGLQYRVNAICKQVNELEIRAPSQGTIEAIDLHPGDIVAPNAPVITLVDRRRFWVRAYIPEKHLYLGKLNSKVHLSIDGFPNRVFQGRVAFVAHLPEFTPNNVQTPETRGHQVYRVRVAVEETTDDLRPGMAADLIFPSGDRDE